MVFTDASFEWLSRLQFNVRAALARSSCEVPYPYEGERFFRSYEALREPMRTARVLSHLPRR